MRFISADVVNLKYFSRTYYTNGGTLFGICKAFRKIYRTSNKTKPGFVGCLKFIKQATRIPKQKLPGYN